MPRKVTFRAGIALGETRELTVQIHDMDATPWGIDTELRVVGTDVPRLDGPDKATGRARYTADVHLLDMVHCRMLVSPFAHARVTSIDIEPARSTKGVVDAEILVDEGGEVRYAGQAVAAVCGDSEEAADDGLHAIRIVWEQLPHVVDVESAMKDDAPRVDPRHGNVRPSRRQLERGDPDTAMQSAHAKVSATFRTQVQTHSALEPHGSVVEPHDDGTFTVYASTQATSNFRRQFAQSQKIPVASVRVISEHVGGGFGAKFGMDVWDQMAAIFARRLGRPVKAMPDRRLEHLAAGNRPSSVQQMTLGADKDGKLVALVGDVKGTSGVAGAGGSARNTMVYRCPNIRMTQATVTTHAGRGRAFRAPGSPQGAFAYDGVVDMLAHEMKIEPLDFRLRNDPHPVRQIQWWLGAEKIGWEKRRRKTPGSDPGPVKRGLGCAAGFWFQAGRGSWNVNLEITADGGVTVSNATQDIGTGTRTLMAILVAEELGIRPDQVTVRLGDTTHPAGPASGGSTTAPSIGPACREAGLRAREALAAKLAEHWKVKPEEISVGDGEFLGPDGKKTSFEQACALIGAEPVAVTGTRRKNYPGFNGETAGCQFAEVAVDTETGVIRVERIVAVHDAGRIVNTLTARSQVIGGVIQGISYALYEDRRLDRATGDMVNPTLDTYRITGVQDTPKIDTILTSIESGFNNAGMMGLGEPATVPTAAAVANAVYNAIGVRMTELPMTPARVHAALRRGR